MNTNNLRRLLTLVCFMFTVAQVNEGTVRAADYPTKPVRFVVPYQSGGATDILSRFLGQELFEVFGQRVVVDNRPGAGGSIGSKMVANAEPDGYTLLMGTNGSHAINTSLYTSLPYDPVKDFTPVILVAQVPLLLVVAPSLPVRSVHDLIALAKAKPGQMNFGSGGIGTSAHLAGEMFNMASNVKTIHVPYKGGPAVIADLIGGRIEFLFQNMPVAIASVKAGRLRALGVTTPKRARALPDVPTMSEAIPGFEIIPWYGVLGPVGLSGSIISDLNSAIDRILRKPQAKKHLSDLGAESVGGTPGQFLAQIKRDIAMYAQAIKASGARAD